MHKAGSVGHKLGMNGIRTFVRALRTRAFGRPILLLLLSSSGGCAFIPGPTASFSTPTAEVRAQCERMKADPVGLSRPLVVLDGWRQFDWSSASLARDLRKLTGANKADLMPVSFPTHNSLDAMADEIVMRVERTWPSDDPGWTIEVDVVGHSMGGIVARLAALPSEENPNRKRLKIRSLYTISTPHRGARMARYFPIDCAAWEMKPGSKTITRLNETLADARYELVCYTQLHDWTVGAKNTAPPGFEPIWTKGTFFASHILARKNFRILGDIALRLRGEPPMAAPSLPPPRN